MPWRRPDSKYAKNEFYLDFVEHLHGIVHASGRPVALELGGYIQGTAWLSGTPEVAVRLTKPALVQDAAWHACVRQAKWASAQTLSFIPPDGAFELGSYRVAAPALGAASTASADAPLPLFAAVQLGEWDAARGTHAFSITVESRLGGARTLTDVVVEWQLGERAQGVDAAVQDYGVASTAQCLGSAADGGGSAPPDAVVFDRRRHLLRWTTASLAPGACTTLRGTLGAHGAPCRPLYALQIRFAVAGHTLTGLRASDIRVEGVTPQAKGVRNTLTGALEWRRETST